MESAELSAKIDEIDILADDLADALAAPNAFWLGAGRRLPGDKRLSLRMDLLDDHCRMIALSIIVRATDISTEELLSIVDATRSHHPRVDALELVVASRNFEPGE